MITKGLRPFVHTVEEKGTSQILRKVDRVTKAVKSELIKNNDGTYIYQKYENEAYPTLKTVFDGKNRCDYVCLKARNGKLKTQMVRQLMKLDSFIEWCDMFFDNSGEIVKEVIKIKGIKTPKIQTDIPKKPVRPKSKAR